MPEFVTVTPEMYADLRSRLPSIRRRHMFERFGISETTWNKMRKGAPIKRSTLARALAHYERWRQRNEMRLAA